MSTNVNNTGIPSDILADTDVLIKAAMAGQKPDPDVAKRVRDRAALVTEKIRQKHGVLDIGVPSIRELRDE